MRSEKARTCLEKCAIQSSGKKVVDYHAALSAVAFVEEEAEDAMQELREKFAADIKHLVDKWEISDQKIDRLWLKEAEAYKADIEKYKREIAELKQRLAIAEKVIEEKTNNQENRSHHEFERISAGRHDDLHTHGREFRLHDAEFGRRSGRVG